MDTAVAETYTMKITSYYMIAHSELAVGHWLMCQGSGQGSIGLSKFEYWILMILAVVRWWWCSSIGNKWHSNMIGSASHEGSDQWLIQSMWHLYCDNTLHSIMKIGWCSQIAYSSPVAFLLICTIWRCPSCMLNDPPQRLSKVGKRVQGNLSLWDFWGSIFRLVVRCVANRTVTAFYLGVYYLLLAVVSSRSTTFCDIRIYKRWWHRSQLQRGLFLALGDLPWGPMVSSCCASSAGCRQQWGTNGPGGFDCGGKRQQWRGVASHIPLGLLNGSK